MRKDYLVNLQILSDLRSFNREVLIRISLPGCSFPLSGLILFLSCSWQLFAKKKKNLLNATLHPGGMLEISWWTQWNILQQKEADICLRRRNIHQVGTFASSNDRLCRSEADVSDKWVFLLLSPSQLTALTNQIFYTREASYGFKAAVRSF